MCFCTSVIVRSAHPQRLRHAPCNRRVDPAQAREAAREGPAGGGVHPLARASGEQEPSASAVGALPQTGVVPRRAGGQAGLTVRETLVAREAISTGLRSDGLACCEILVCGATRRVVGDPELLSRRLDPGSAQVGVAFSLYDVALLLAPTGGRDSAHRGLRVDGARPTRGWAQDHQHDHRAFMRTRRTNGAGRSTNSLPSSPASMGRSVGARRGVRLCDASESRR